MFTVLYADIKTYDGGVDYSLDTPPPLDFSNTKDFTFKLHHEGAFLSFFFGGGYSELIC